MTTKNYYDTQRQIAQSNLVAAADVRDRPTLDQYSAGVDGDRHVSRAADHLQVIDAAEEQGLTVTEYRDLVAAEAAKKPKTREQSAADHAAEQISLRRQVGLPGDVLPDAIFTRSGGSIGIKVPGMSRFHFGGFTVDTAGKFVAQ